MSTNDQAIQDEIKNPGYFIAGVMLGGLLGALAGAGAMLLLAPQSGEKTRKQIRRKGRDIRVHTTDTIEDGVGAVRAKVHDVTTGVHDQAEALQQRGAEMVDEQKERWSPVVEAGKTAVNGN